MQGFCAFRVLQAARGVISGEGWCVCVCVLRALNSFLIDLSLVFLGVGHAEHIFQHIFHVNIKLCLRGNIILFMN